MGTFSIVAIQDIIPFAEQVYVTGCLADHQVWFPGVSRRHFDQN